MALSTAVSLLAGVAFGLALAAPPGPMNAIIAEESVLRGWTSGFRAGLGAMAADLVFFLLALVGLVTVVERSPTLRGVMVTVGGLLMLYFAVGAARNTRATLAGETPGDGSGFSRAFLLSLTNPYQILFWLTVGVALLDTGRLDVLAALPGEPLERRVVVETGSPALLAGLFLGIGVWIVSFPAALVSLGDRTETVTPVVAAASALVLAGFGAVFLWDGLGVLV